MIAEPISHCHILDKLGEGGMGVPSTEADGISSVGNFVGASTLKADDSVTYPLNNSSASRPRSCQ